MPLENQLTQESGTERDRRQVILPNVDTSYDAVKDLSFAEALAFLPAALMTVIGGLALIMGAMVVFGMLIPLTLAAWAATFHINFQTQRKWYLTPLGFLQSYFTYRRLKRSLPFGIAGALTGTHDLERMGRDEYGEPYVIRHDGTIATVVDVDGRNTNRLSSREKGQIVKQLTDGVDENIKDRWWAFYGTTRPSSTAGLADHREERADATMENDLTSEQRDLLRESAADLREGDRRHNANEWRHYVTVEATVADIEYPAESIRGMATQALGVVVDALDTERFAVSDHVDVEDVGEDEDVMRLQEEVLQDRVDDVMSAVGRVRGVESERASMRDQVEVTRRFWTDDSFDEDDESLLGMVERGVRNGSDAYTPFEHMLASGGLSVDGDTVNFGDTYARTLWISTWPIMPKDLFFDRLYSMGGIDMDVKIHAQPTDKWEALADVEDLIVDIDAELKDRIEKNSVGAMTISDKAKAYANAYKELEGSNAQAWKINGFVTVRGNSRKKLAENVKDVRRTLESNPAACYPVVSTTSQFEAFKSSSPFSHDVYDSAARNSRSHVALAGAFGALFPFSSISMREIGGIMWGRNTKTGESMVADPNKRGAAPHLTTIGKSRAGKTTFVKERCAGWYLDDPDDTRTLILIDTQGEFAELTDTLDGEHYRIGGQQSTNPFKLVRPPDEQIKQATVDADEGEAEWIGDPLASKIAELSQMIANIVLAGSRDESLNSTASVPYDLINHALELTYQRAGFEHDDLDSFENDSPYVDDFLDTLGYMGENLEEFTHHGREGEKERLEDDIDDLLSNLKGFLDGGKYANMLGDGDIDLLDDDVRVAYLDCQHFRDEDGAEKSIGLQQAWSQVSQKIKQAPGETAVVLDEAHVMYQSEKMISWLEDAAREWARFDTFLWSVSQSPEEFIRQQSGSNTATENTRRVILEQCSTLQVFRVSDQTSEATLREFGLKDPQIRAAQEDLVPGRDRDHSTCLVRFSDRHGWIECRVDILPFLPEPETDEGDEQEEMRAGSEFGGSMLDAATDGGYNHGN